MAEAVGLVASIVQIAGTGAKLSSTLYHYTTTAVRADQDIADIASDIDLTSNALESIGKVLETEDHRSIVSKKAILDANSIIKRCEAVFKDISGLVEKRQTVSKHGKKSLSVMGKLSWPMKEQRLELYRKRLESLKNSLTLLLHVLQLAQGQARGQLERDAVEHEREKIREFHQRQQDSLQCLQALESKLCQISIDDESISGSAPLPSQAANPSLPSVCLSQIPGALGSVDDQIQCNSDLYPSLSDSDIDTTDSEVGATDEGGETLSMEELAQAEQHVLRLLKRIKGLQKSFPLGKSGQVHHKKRMNRIYQRFRRHWETNLMCACVVPPWIVPCKESTYQSEVHDLQHPSIHSTTTAPKHTAAKLPVAGSPRPWHTVHSLAPLRHNHNLRTPYSTLISASQKESQDTEKDAASTAETPPDHYDEVLVCDYPDCGKLFYRPDLLLRHRNRHNEPDCFENHTILPVTASAHPVATSLHPAPIYIPMKPSSFQEEMNIIPRYTMNPFRTPQLSLPSFSSVRLPETDDCNDTSPFSGYKNLPGALQGPEGYSAEIPGLQQGCEGETSTSPSPSPMIDDFRSSTPLQRPCSLQTEREFPQPSHRATSSPIHGLRQSIQVTCGGDIGDSPIQWMGAYVTSTSSDKTQASANTLVKKTPAWDTTNTIGEKRVGRRRGSLRPEQRQQAHQIRSAHAIGHNRSSFIPNQIMAMFLCIFRTMMEYRIL
ncbi:hypothetical protein DE146DRAFT_338997 [Phaeosphaeria sp. MPI-PUGE-AT-0046c]|nr:hypothetical protein DE146DRAFT_338997 [Phaeosphaeria sp. MPI-PUGE-AT-0046c]